MARNILIILIWVGFSDLKQIGNGKDHGVDRDIRGLTPHPSPSLPHQLPLSRLCVPTRLTKKRKRAGVLSGGSVISRFFEQQWKKQDKSHFPTPTPIIPPSLLSLHPSSTHPPSPISRHKGKERREKEKKEKKKFFLFFFSDFLPSVTLTQCLPRLRPCSFHPLPSLPKFPGCACTSVSE